MTTQIRPSQSEPYCYHLYVDGDIAVANESMTVCEEIKSALEQPMTRPVYYSETAEVADRIRRELR